MPSSSPWVHIAAATFPFCVNIVANLLLTTLTDRWKPALPYLAIELSVLIAVVAVTRWMNRGAVTARQAVTGCLWQPRRGNTQGWMAHFLALPPITPGASFEDEITQLAFTPDGKRLVSASHDRTIRLWDVATGKESRRFVGHQGIVWSIAVSADGRTLASGSEDTTALIWDLTGKK